MSRTVSFAQQVEPPDVFVCLRCCLVQEVAVWGKLVGVDGLRL